jgi:ketosteroid isomerase-like protein
MSSAHVDVARQGYDALNRADWPAIRDLLHPSVRWRMSTRFARAERVFHGRDGMRELFVLFEESFEDFHAEPHDFIAADAWVVVPVTLRGRVRGSTDVSEFELAQALFFRDSLIAGHEAYATAEEALGALRNGTSSTSSDGGTGREK